MPWLYCCSVTQSRRTLCNIINCRLPDSSVREILQARILEWVEISSPRGSSWSRDRTCISWIGMQILYHWATWEALDYVILMFTPSPNFRHMPPGICSRSQTLSLSLNHQFAAAKLLQSCPTLCDPMDSSPAGSSVHGILLARILEWVAMPSSEDLPDPGLNHRFFTAEPQGKPKPPLYTPPSSKIHSFL